MIQEVVEQIESTARDVMTSNLHTSMPAVIKAIDEEKGLVDLKPSGSYYINGLEMEYPLIPSVPLVLDIGENVAAVSPIKVGDNVMMVCAEQSISKWLTETDKDQMDERFELQNAMAVPGLQKKASELQKEANADEAYIVVNGEHQKVKIYKDKIEITSADVKILVQNGEITITGTNNISMSGNVSIEGNLDVGGNITCGGDFPCRSTQEGE